MNATDFINKSEYEEICKLYHKQADIDYRKSVKREMGKYDLSIHNFWYDGKVYKMSVWLDYNHKDSRGELYGNSIGGGDVCNFIANDYEAFKTRLNERLKKFPDYDELEQMTLF